MSEVKVNPNNLVGDEREQLLALIEKANKKPKRFKPKKDGFYWCVTGKGSVEQSRWGNDLYDEWGYNTGNCFATEEEAEFELERCKVIAELEIFAIENNDEIDWRNNRQYKYSLCYQHRKGILEIDCRFYGQGLGDIYFSSEELCEQAIEKVGEDRIKKYLFGVEE